MGTAIFAIGIFGYAGYLVYKLVFKRESGCHEVNCNCAAKEQAARKSIIK